MPSEKITEYRLAAITPKCYRRVTRPATNTIADLRRAFKVADRDCPGCHKTNLSKVFAGQYVGARQIDDQIWLVTFMHYGLGCFDHQTCRLESADNPFAAKVLPMCPV